jgi:hypothetical protein
MLLTWLAPPLSTMPVALDSLLLLVVVAVVGIGGISGFVGLLVNR